MPTRTVKPPRDPLAEDRVERFFYRVGFGRVLGVTLGLAVAGTIALVLALSTLGVGAIALEAVNPTLPGRVLGLVDPAPNPTDRVARAAQTVPTTPPADSPRADAPSSTPTTAPAVAAPPAHATMAARRVPAARPAPSVSVLTPSTPPARPMQAPPAAAARPAPAPTTAPPAPPAPPVAPAPAAPAPTTATQQPAPAPTTPTDDGSANPGKGHGKGNGGCPPGQHKKGKC